MTPASPLSFCLGHLALLLATITLVNATPFSSPRTNSIIVKPGESIQTAIDNAPAGSKIEVKAGTYAEQLLITKDGITLSGQHAILIPPPTPIDNFCTGLAGLDQYTGGTLTQVGICVLGTDVVLEPFMQEHRHVKSVGTYVKDVTIQGFEVHNFTGLNIALVGTENARVARNTLVDGHQYGALTVGSKSSTITRNKVVAASFLYFIGICMDDITDVHVTQNRISGYGIGLCVQTDAADVGHNKVTETCAGCFVDPGVKGAKVTHNHISKTNPLCGPFFGETAFGIVLAGAIDTEVHNNDIEHITDYGFPNSTAAGIAIFDDPKSVATGNEVTFNTLLGNDENFVVMSNGTNVVDHNK